MRIVIDGVFFRKGRHGNAKHNHTTYNRTFPGLNDFINLRNRTKNYHPNSSDANARERMSKKYQDIASTFIRLQVEGTINGRVFIYYDFYERDRRRSPSNISGFFIRAFEKALKSCGVISGKGWDIAGFACYFHVDRKHPRIEVTLEELDDDGSSAAVPEDTPEDDEDDEEDDDDE